jgi:hypothetical protein
LVQTVTARFDFGIIARHKRFGGYVGAFLPHTARQRLYNAGVSALVTGKTSKNVILIGII